MVSATQGPRETNRRSFRRIPGSDWFLVIAFMLAILLLVPITISVGYIVAGVLIFPAFSFLPAYLWLRLRRPRPRGVEIRVLTQMPVAAAFERREPREASAGNRTPGV